MACAGLAAGLGTHETSKDGGGEKVYAEEGGVDYMGIGCVCSGAKECSEQYGEATQTIARDAVKDVCKGLTRVCSAWWSDGRIGLSGER